MTPPMGDIGFLLVLFAAGAVFASVGLGIVFNLIERARKAKSPRYDHFGSRFSD